MTWTFRVDDLAYAAGYLDGEGCFTLHGSTGYVPSVYCETTHRPTIQWLQMLLGGNLSSYERKKKPHWRPTYRWSVHGTAAVEVCHRLLLLLKEKRPQAEILIEAGTWPKFQGRRSGVPAAELEYRGALRARLKELKHAT